MISGNLVFLCGILTFQDQCYSLKKQTKQQKNSQYLLKLFIRQIKSISILQKICALWHGNSLKYFDKNSIKYKQQSRFVIVATFSYTTLITFTKPIIYVK